MVNKGKRALKRFFARLFDYYLFTLIVGIALFLTGVSDFFVDASSLMIFLKTSPIIILFELICLSAYGTTPGKFCMGLYVMDKQKNNLDFTDNLIRTSVVVLLFGAALNYDLVIFAAVMAVSFLCYVYGLSMFWDKLSSSVVYYKRWDFVNYIFASLLVIVVSVIMILAISGKLDEMNEKARMGEIHGDYGQDKLDNSLSSPFSGGQK